MFSLQLDPGSDIKLTEEDGPTETIAGEREIGREGGWEGGRAGEGGRGKGRGR